MKGIGKFMHECRNELAFHYDSKGDVLMAGYRRHFGRTRGEHAGNDHLYVSLGNNMEKSRFFYADAAVIAAQNEKLQQHQVAKAELQRLTRDVNQALRFVVGELLAHFKQEASPLPRRRG